MSSVEEEAGAKFRRKARDNPMLSIGILAFLGSVGYGAYKFKHRGDMSMSFYLVQMRVACQGMFVAALGLSVAYTMGSRIVNYVSRKE